MKIIKKNHIIRLTSEKKICILCRPPSYPWLVVTETKINIDKKVMKTIAILALTAAALVSCQQQQQQQQVVTPTPEPAPVAPIKK